VFDEIYWVDRPREPCPERLENVWLPKDVQSFYGKEMAAALAEIVGRGETDLVHVEFDLMAPYAAAISGVPKIWTMHDVGAISFFQSYFREMKGLGKFRRIPHWIARVAYEKKAASWFDHVVTLTEADRRRFSLICPRRKISVVSSGVDLDHFSGNEAAAFRATDAIVYVGHYAHYPNEDAVVYFCREILPLIRRRFPSIVFNVVGSVPTRPVRELPGKYPHVFVTGLVEDVKPYLRGAKVFVAPVRIGQGIKGKILEAFAMGLPVVASSRAAEGITAMPGRDLLVADDPRKFADAVCGLLESPAARERLGKAGQTVAQGRYGWDRLSDQLDAVYTEVIAAHAAGKEQTAA
jgi:glycosyltransferase involved in cell wall biosynthesis